MASRRPTADDEREVVALVLRMIGEGASFDELEARVQPFHPKHYTFPGEVFLAMAADALEVAGVDRHSPVAVSEVKERWPWPPTGRTYKYKCSYVVWTVGVLRSGIEPDLIDEGEGGVWREDDLWMHALAGLVAFIDVAAGRLGVERVEVCRQLAERRADAI